MSDFPEKAEDKVNTLAIVAIGLATTAMLWASVVALQAYFSSSENQIAVERAAMGLTSEVRTLQTSQQNDLKTTMYADRNKGTLKRLSIENAKKAVVRDAARGAKTLIPTLGPLDVATIPAVAGRPADNVQPPAPGTPPVAPADGGAVVPAGGDTQADGVAPSPAAPTP